MDKNILLSFIDQGFSQREIAKKTNCSQTNIRFWLKKYNLETLPKPTLNIKTCLRCKQEKSIDNFYKRKNRKNGSSYCKSCSTIVSKEIKAVKLIKCKYCEEKIDKDRNESGSCLTCYTNKLIQEKKSIILKDLKLKHKNKNTPHWYSAEIRNFARRWNKDLIKKPCQICNYSNHTELCHIKPIKDFDDSATLGEINHPSNIIVLCPNHHWEFDNGILKLKN
jgi:hypothetical protein